MEYFDNKVTVISSNSNSIYTSNYSIEIDENWVSAFEDAKKRMEENKKKEELQKKQQRNKRLRGMVKKVIFSDDCTIVFWNDGTKTMARCHEDDVYDQEKGILVCMAKKLYEGTNIFQEVIEKNVSNFDNVRDYCRILEADNKMLFDENRSLFYEISTLCEEIDSLKIKLADLKSELERSE